MTAVLKRWGKYRVRWGCRVRSGDSCNFPRSRPEFTEYRSTRWFFFMFRWQTYSVKCAFLLPASTGPGASPPCHGASPGNALTGWGWLWPPCGRPPCRDCSQSCSCCRCCWRCCPRPLCLLPRPLLHLHSSGCCCYCWERRCWWCCWPSWSSCSNVWLGDTVKKFKWRITVILMYHTILNYVDDVDVAFQP